jgi:hypothetical protein
LGGCYLDLNDGLANYAVYYLLEIENNSETTLAVYEGGQFRVEKGGKPVFFKAEYLFTTIPAHSSEVFSLWYWGYSSTGDSFNFVLNDGTRDYLFAGWREQVYQAPDAVVYGLGYVSGKKRISFERDGKTETYSFKGVVDVYGKLRLVFNSPDDIQCAVVGNLTTDKASVFGDMDVRY